MTPDQAIAQAQSGTLLPVYLLLGEERYLRARVIETLRSCSGAGSIPGLNDDEFTAGDAPLGRVLGAARTSPMMAKLRWVAVRDIERWDSKSASSEGQAEGLDPLVAYLANPVPTTLLVLSATKLAAKNPVLVAARARGALVSCDLLSKQALPAWLAERAASRQAPLSRSAAELLVEVVGGELSALDDVLERLSLFAGAGAPITEETIAALIPIVRPATVWELLDAIGRRQTHRALELLAKVFDPADRGIRLVGLILWSTRQMLRYQGARQRGLAAPEAAKAAGVPPFKARELEQVSRALGPSELESWLITLRDVDLALKGGSRRPARAILESAVIQLCGAGVSSAVQRLASP
jgi:DNA polymerase III subunit delta